MTSHTSHVLAKVFLVFSVLLFLGTVWWFLPPLDQKRILLVVTGFSKGRLKPSKARFLPHRGKWMGGVAHVGGAYQKLIASYSGEAHAFFSLGSELSGTADTYFSRGQAMADVLNKFGLSAMLLGNIEFTFGKTRLAEISRTAGFPFLASNILVEGTQTPPEFLKNSLLLPLDQGVVLGVLGLAPPNTPELTARGNVAGLDFDPPATRLASLVADLRQRGAHLVVLLTQYDEGQIPEEDWQSIVKARPDVCFMVDFEVEPPEPEFRDGILVKTVSGYNRTQELDLLEVQAAPGGRILSFAGRRIPITSDRIPPDQNLQKEVRRISAQTRALKVSPLGQFLDDVERNYREECPIANLVADAMRAHFQADLAFQNSGGIQNNIRAGVMTQGDLFDILPFDNQIVCMELSGEEILEILMHSASLRRGLLQISGGSYVFSQRGVDDYNLKSVMIGSATLQPGESYQVTTNSFLAEGGDGYLGFRRGKNVRYGSLQREAVRGYIEALSASQPIHLQTEGRIIREE